MELPRPNAYLVLLRRELTRAQARLRRCERERDALRAALTALRNNREEDHTLKKRNLASENKSRHRKQK
jgi:hypothetical protein